VTLEFVILGSGSSGGVPRADGNWGACDPAEPRNQRTRCSMLVRRRGADGAETTVLVDTSPDLRLQTAWAGVKRLDAILYTHDHADQAHGIDDIRAFVIGSGLKRIPAYMDGPTRATLTRRFDYVFETAGIYPALAEARDLPTHGTPWAVEGPGGPVPVVSFDQDHGTVRSAGFRFGPLAYSADVVDLPESAFEALAGVQVWIVDALRWTPHPTHAHVQRALEWIARVRPDRAILTNLHIDLDYNDLRRQLPAGVEPAYDGLTLTFPA
jgi:phosphoribosyl 1,2-cyclic phosphate phosphodiesterase